MRSEARVQSVISRGKVDVFVNLTNTGGDAVSVTVNEPLAQAYIDALWRLYELGDGQRVRMDYKATDLAGFPMCSRWRSRRRTRIR